MRTWLIVLTLFCPLLLPAPAAAQIQQLVVRGLLCDTQEQLERLVSLPGALRDAIQTVNTEVNKKGACGFATAILEREQDVGMVTSPDNTVFRIVRVVLIVDLTRGYPRPIERTTLYLLELTAQRAT